MTDTIPEVPGAARYGNLQNVKGHVAIDDLRERRPNMTNLFHDQLSRNDQVLQEINSAWENDNGSAGQSRLRGFEHKDANTTANFTAWFQFLRRVLLNIARWSGVHAQDQDRSRFLKAPWMTRIVLRLLIIPEETANDIARGVPDPSPFKIALRLPECCSAHKEEGAHIVCDSATNLMNMLEDITRVQTVTRESCQVIDKRCGSHVGRCNRHAHPSPDRVILAVGLVDTRPTVIQTLQPGVGAAAEPAPTHGNHHLKTLRSCVPRGSLPNPKRKRPREDAEDNGVEDHRQPKQQRTETRASPGAQDVPKSPHLDRVSPRVVGSCPCVAMSSAGSALMPMDETSPPDHLGFYDLGVQGAMELTLPPKNEPNQIDPWLPMHDTNTL